MRRKGPICVPLVFRLFVKAGRKGPALKRLTTPMLDNLHFSMLFQEKKLNLRSTIQLQNLITLGMQLKCLCSYFLRRMKHSFNYFNLYSSFESHLLSHTLTRYSNRLGVSCNSSRTREAVVIYSD